MSAEVRITEQGKGDFQVGDRVRFLGIDFSGMIGTGSPGRVTEIDSTHGELSIRAAFVLGGLCWVTPDEIEKVED